MANSITHDGIVENMDGNHIQVKIIQTSACSQCSVKGHCTSADNQEKLIDIYTDDSTYQLGERVRITGETSMGMMAVCMAFVVPFLIIVVSLFLAMACTQNELLSVGLSFGLLVLYYIILAFNKDKMKTKFSFKVKHINS